VSRRGLGAIRRTWLVRRPVWAVMDVSGGCGGTESVTFVLRSRVGEKKGLYIGNVSWFLYISLSINRIKNHSCVELSYCQKRKEDFESPNGLYFNVVLAFLLISRSSHRYFYLRLTMTGRSWLFYY